MVTTGSSVEVARLSILDCCLHGQADDQTGRRETMASKRLTMRAPVGVCIDSGFRPALGRLTNKPEAGPI